MVFKTLYLLLHFLWFISNEVWLGFLHTNLTLFYLNLFSFCFYPGGFVGLLLGYSFYNFYLMIFESIEKAVRYKEKRKESKKNSNGVGQSIAIANHFQKRINGKEKNDTTPNKQSQDGFWLEPNKKSNMLLVWKMFCRVSKA